jgi:hypothetical protein
MTHYVYSRHEDGSVTAHRLHEFNGDLITEDGELVVLCRDCREPISRTNWNGRCLPCHETIVG